jgi:quercetin dioxygenase-like cupin family protein
MMADDIHLERIPWDGAEPPTEAALRERLAAEGFGAFRWHDAPGATYAPHTHDRDESLWMLEGEITFGAGGREFRLGPGDRLMLPRGTVHTARVGPAGATYLIGERG